MPTFDAFDIFEYAKLNGTVHFFPFFSGKALFPASLVQNFKILNLR